MQERLPAGQVQGGYASETSRADRYLPTDQPSYLQDRYDRSADDVLWPVYMFKPWGLSPEVDYVAIARTGISSRRLNLFNPSRWEGTVVDADGDFAPGYRMFSAVVAEPAQTAVLRVGLSMDAWETVVTQKPDQAGSAGFNRLDHPWTVLFEEAEVGATPDQTQVTLETTIVAWEAYGKLAPRLLAVTSDGREHTTPYAKGNWESGRTIIFDLPLSSVKEVQFQVSPYDWVEFRNISLKPRQKTVPTVVALGESASAKK